MPEPAQRGRDPQTLVVAAPRIETDDEPGCADAIGEVFDVVRQVGAARLLARFDEHDEAGVAAAGGVQRLDGGECGERRVPVVGPAAAVEPPVLDDRCPGPEAFAPADHLGLLVEVAVQDDRVVVETGHDRVVGQIGVGGGHLHQQQWAASGQPVDLDREPRNRPGCAPGPDELDGSIDVAVRRPLGVEAR